MVGPTDKSNNSPINTVSDTEPLNTLGTANTNMNLHPGFLDLINGTVNRNISPKDVIPTIPPADTPLDSDSVDSTTDDLKQAAQKLQDMLATFQAAYDGAKNRNPSAVLLLNLGNQMVDLINGWMTMSFEQMLAQLTMTLSLAEEIAKQQQDQAEETKKSSEYAAIGQIVSGAAGLTMAVGTLAVQTYKEARATSAEKELTEAEVPAGQAAGLPALEAEQVSLSQDIAKNSEEQATLTKTLESAEKNANDLTTQRDQAKDQLENDQVSLTKGTEKVLQEALEETIQSFDNPNRTDEQTAALRTILSSGSGLDAQTINSILENPNELETGFFRTEIDEAFIGANEREAMDNSIVTLSSSPEEIMNARQLNDTLEAQYVERENLNKTILSFKDPNRTDEQTAELRTILFSNSGLDEETINYILKNPDPTAPETGFYQNDIDEAFIVARENMNAPITANENIFKTIDPDIVRLALNPALSNAQLEQVAKLKSQATTSQTTVDESELALQNQQQKVKTARENYDQAVKTGEDLEASQKTNDEAIERTKAAIKTATKDQATKATSARQKAERFMAAGGPAQILTGAIQNVTTLITGAFNIVSADKKYNADMIAATITKLQAQSSAASQYMSTSKSQYDNYLQSLLTILSKLSDAMSSNTQAGR